MLTKTIMALAIAIVAAVPVDATAQDGFDVRAGWQVSTSWNDNWGDGCLVWRRGVDYFGRERLIQVNICN